jgi:hypothetical protein
MIKGPNGPVPAACTIASGRAFRRVIRVSQLEPQQQSTAQMSAHDQRFPEFDATTAALEQFHKSFNDLHKLEQQQASHPLPDGTPGTGRIEWRATRSGACWTSSPTADDFFAGVDPDDDHEYRPGPPGALKRP